MPVRAALLYLDAKALREIYVTDMLFYTARGFVAKHEDMPRYCDLIRPRRAARRTDYTVNDVIDMFRGKGALCH